MASYSVKVRVVVEREIVMEARDRIDAMEKARGLQKIHEPEVAIPTNWVLVKREIILNRADGRWESSR